MPDPYYSDDLVTLYHGDCREITEWLTADVLVMDPPYGRGWGSHGGYNGGVDHKGIVGDESTAARDTALALWGERRAVVFGDLMLSAPAGAKQVLVYAKPPGSGLHGAVNGYFRDAEAVYLVGSWVAKPAGRSSIIRSGASFGGFPANRYGHPHAKPVDVMEGLIRDCPDGTIADPFAGSGSTLVAARNLGRPTIGVELEERYCEQAARRLSQMVLV